MKKQYAIYSFIFAMSLYFFYSCSKSNSTTPSSSNNNNTASPLVGNWGRYIQTTSANIEFTGNNSYTFTFDGYPGETGTFTSTSSSVIFTAKPSGIYCVGIPGSYNFTISGTKLTFSLAKDSCGRPPTIVATWDKR